jgi:type I restriction-modification system DNA methylase subunit
LRLHSGIPSQLHGRFDVVLTNPPFGTKNSQGLFSCYLTFSKQNMTRKFKIPVD